MSFSITSETLPAGLFMLSNPGVALQPGKPVTQVWAGCIICLIITVVCITCRLPNDGNAECASPKDWRQLKLANEKGKVNSNNTIFRFFYKQRPGISWQWWLGRLSWLLCWESKHQSCSDWFHNRVYMCTLSWAHRRGDCAQSSACTMLCWSWRFVQSGFDRIVFCFIF